MLIRITLFLNVLAYSLIVGQRVFYMPGHRNRVWPVSVQLIINH